MYLVDQIQKCICWMSWICSTLELNLELVDLDDIYQFDGLDLMVLSYDRLTELIEFHILFSVTQLTILSEIE